jgi:hypothetical protein|tara:strand:+ start:249 stop:485 length:237 start_codon:yes stop_codon:yes gene_type:complete
MLLYTEEQLDTAYRIDCKARTESGHAWVLRETFRPIYENLLESFMIAYDKDAFLADDVPEYLLNSVNDLLKITLTIDP